MIYLLNNEGKEVKIKVNHKNHTSKYKSVIKKLKKL